MTLSGNRVKMRSLVYTVTQFYHCAYEKATSGQRERHAQREDSVKVHTDKTDA